MSQACGWLIQEWAVFVAMIHSPLIRPRRIASRISWYARLFCAGMQPASISSSEATSARSFALRKSRPANKFVMFPRIRDPIALHWPVIELAPVPGRPMFPVISARLMMACATRVPS